MKIFPDYNLEEIKFGTDKATFEQAVRLYEAGEVRDFRAMMEGFSATVIGTKPYHILFQLAIMTAGTVIAI